MDKIRVARNLKTTKLESFSTMVNVDISWTIDRNVSIFEVSEGPGYAHNLLYRA